MSEPNEHPLADPPSFRQAVLFWLKLGFISFGGPAGQIAIMHRELVQQKRWISEVRFLHALNYCMLIPGPEAQQLATYIGWILHKTRGGVVAGVLFVLPSLLMLIALSWAYLAWGSSPIMQGILYGIKPAVLALVLFAVYRIGSRTLKNPLLWAVGLCAFGVVAFFNVSFIFVVIGAALIGAIGGRLNPRAFSPRADSTIDNPVPKPDRSTIPVRSLVKTGVVGATLWLLPFIILLAFFGWQGTLTQMAWFFTQAALVTFGGAYAVLPFVFQNAVGVYGWLSPSQMMDGLALGESTPGPLIIVVAFIGFVGAWTNAVLGPELNFLSGALGAFVVAWFTFLPSFLFILVGGPFIEASKGNIGLTAPLTAITASVVGVIGSLAIFFASHVLWPKGFELGLDWSAVLLSIGALAALTILKRNALEVIIACALVGVGLRYLLA